MRTRFLVGITVTDLAALAVAMVAGSVIVFGTPAVWDARIDLRHSLWPLLGVMAAGALIMCLATASMSGHGVPRPTYGRLLMIVTGTFLLTTTASFMVRTLPYSRSYVPVVLGVWAALGAAHRYLRRRRPWTERFVVITSDKNLADELRESPHVEIVSVIDPQTDGELEPIAAGCAVAVDLRSALSAKVAQFVSSCDLAGFNVRALASVYQEHLRRVPLVHLNEGWEISTPLRSAQPWLPGKHLIDSVITLATAPLWVTIGAGVWAFVKLTSPGPAIFRQRRIGRGGEPFTMYKFRTMALDAEELGPRFASEDDVRFIRGGTFLRRSRLDEIPQLFNVLRGEMSLVGPRAEQVPFVRQFRKRIPFYDLRHLVRPGITGWAQVNYGYADDAADTIEKLSYDLYYIQHMSPALDLQVLWKSIWTVLTGAGAR
ncbi:MAG TPA: exopolysaccharide biosynthesis polyprenyl glycosylphosphotransferase [Acidimicrobiia bacterium]|nr:exopolysaccharide biosynthesis polyprenyl glycosylphosphotransferase [Acidimicrobiia bacterium]